jgi:transcriptional regulator with XRE-family HTH domain
VNHEAEHKIQAISSLQHRARSEPELRELIVEALRASGITVDQQVACASGAADIVTARRDAVIEVKLDLTHKAVQMACGQVLLYRQAINPDARAIVVGYATGETAGLINWAAAVGVEVICWDGDGTSLKEELIKQPSQLTLAWNIQSHALGHGLTSVSKLAAWLNKPRASLYGLWRGTQVNVSVATLEHLAKRLGPTPTAWLQPGDWFRWDSDGRLIWQVKTVAEQVGLNASQLAFTSGLYAQQVSLYWHGNNGKFVFVETLARLASALETIDRPFDFGDLFSPRRPVIGKEDP